MPFSASPAGFITLSTATRRVFCVTRAGSAGWPSGVKYFRSMTRPLLAAGSGTSGEPETATTAFTVSAPRFCTFTSLASAAAPKTRL